MKIYIYWVVITLLIAALPAYMYYCGQKLFKETPDRKCIYSFKTRRSKLSPETWEYANLSCGKIWINIGEKLFPVAVLTMIFVFGKQISTVTNFALMLIAIEIILFVYSVVLVQKGLKEHFDDEGNRK